METTSKIINVEAEKDIVRILDFAEKTAQNFKTAYTELKFAGYLTWLGGLLIFLTFVLSLVGNLGLSFQSQVLFVVGGVSLMLLGGCFLTLQNMLTYKLEVQSKHLLLETTKLRHALQMKAFDISANPTPPVEPEPDFIKG